MAAPIQELKSMMDRMSLKQLEKLIDFPGYGSSIEIKTDLVERCEEEPEALEGLLEEAKAILNSPEAMIYVPANAQFNDDDEVLITYNVLVSALPKMEKIFKKHNLEWEEEECIDSDEDGDCLEWAGTLIGKYKDAIEFLKGAHPGEKNRKLDSYITKI